MTIKVEEREDRSFDISWDKNDSKESMLNNWTKEDFENAFANYLNELKELNETHERTETPTGDVN